MSRWTIFPLACSCQFDFPSSPGSDRLTKIVYLRFQGAGMDLVNFTDDIILDQTAPVVKAAQLITTVKPKAGAARASKSHSYRIRLKANDPIVGVCTVQVSSGRSKLSTLHLANCHQRGILRVTRTVRVTSANKPRYLRVRNSAGKWSRWKKLS